MSDIFAILVNPRDGRLYSGVGSVDDGGVFVCDLAGTPGTNGGARSNPRHPSRRRSRR